MFISITISCEEIIEVDVPSEEPRLIIDALIKVDFSEPFINLKVKVGLTSPYFDKVPVTNLKQISIMNVNKPHSFFDPNYAILLETEPGIYEKSVSNTFFDGGDGEFLLAIDHGDEIYLAKTYFMPVNHLQRLEQVENSGGNTGLSVTFKDEEYQEDFYLFDFDFGNLTTLSDIFFRNERYTFTYHYDELFDPGTEVEVSIMGIDRSFYNYMNVLLEQNSNEFDLFSTPVATVRGNIINATDIDNNENYDNVALSDNFALGYFAVVQTSTRTITIE